MDNGMKSIRLLRGAVRGGQLVSGPSLSAPRASVYLLWAQGLRSGSHGHGLPPGSKGSKTRPQAGQAGIRGSEVEGFFSCSGNSQDAAQRMCRPMRAAGSQGFAQDSPARSRH